MHGAAIVPRWPWVYVFHNLSTGCSQISHKRPY